MYQTWREYEKEYSVFGGIEYSTKCAQIPTDIECILVTNNSMLHASMTTKVQNSILIDALHFNIQTNWNENHYSCYFFLDYWFSPYEFLLWFWLETLIPTQTIWQITLDLFITNWGKMGQVDQFIWKCFLGGDFKGSNTLWHSFHFIENIPSH